MRLPYNSNKVFLAIIITILLISSTLVIPNFITQNALAQINSSNSSSSNVPFTPPHTLSAILTHNYWLVVLQDKK